MCLATFALALAVVPMCAQTVPAALGQGWLSEFNHAAEQILALAEATPPEKYAWRPAPGVRSTSEVLMHVAEGNFWLLGQAGSPVELPMPAPPAPAEKSVTGKDEILKWLRASFDAVRKAYPTADRGKKVTFLTKETAAENVFLRVLVHNHEHMGQLIGYARMSGVKPPWSR